MTFCALVAAANAGAILAPAPVAYAAHGPAYAAAPVAYAHAPGMFMLFLLLNWLIKFCLIIV